MSLVEKTSPLISIQPSVLATLVAALVAALAGFLGLVLAKEAKVSEFRQEWIDALRADGGELVAQLLSFYRLSGIPKNDDELNARSQAVTQAQGALTRIRLRLHKDDNAVDVVALRSAVARIHQLINARNLEREDILQAEEQFVTATDQVLKNEWERVKRGEPVYRRSVLVAKIVAVLAVLLLGIAAVTAFLGSPEKSSPAMSQSTSINFPAEHCPNDGPLVSPHSIGPSPRSRLRARTLPISHDVAQNPRPGDKTPECRYQDQTTAQKAPAS